MQIRQKMEPISKVKPTRQDKKSIVSLVGDIHDYLKSYQHKENKAKTSLKFNNPSCTLQNFNNQPLVSEVISLFVHSPYII